MPSEFCVYLALNLITLFSLLNVATSMGRASLVTRYVMPSKHGGVVVEPLYSNIGVVSRCFTKSPKSSEPVLLKVPGLAALSMCSTAEVSTDEESLSESWYRTERIMS